MELREGDRYIQPRYQGSQWRTCWSALVRSSQEMAGIENPSVRQHRQLESLDLAEPWQYHDTLQWHLRWLHPLSAAELYVHQWEHISQPDLWRHTEKDLWQRPVHCGLKQSFRTLLLLYRSIHVNPKSFFSYMDIALLVPTILWQLLSRVRFLEFITTVVKL